MDQKPYRQKRKAEGKIFEYELKYLHNITIDYYDELLKKQNGVCAICLKACNKNKRLSVDHDHKTGKVRGLLCNKCNRALGMFKDDPKLLRSAARYILNS
jgi:epoxyqueuosine reductase QueG